MEVDNSYIKIAIDELNELVGVKNLNNSIKIISLLKQNNVSEAIKVIAQELTLPVEIKIFFEGEISENQLHSFVSNSMVKYDNYSKRGISAQVYIPYDLPVYGSKQFENYEIKILLNRNLLSYKETFIMVIAHELSHILLESMKFFKKNNEVYVDLIQILFGFDEYYKKGRIILEKISETQYRKTTIGYLSDENVLFASNYVQKINTENQKLKAKFNYIELELNKLKLSIEKNFEYLKTYLNELDLKKASVKKEHIEVIIKMHDLNFLSDLNSRRKKLNLKLSDTINVISNIRFNTYGKKILNENISFLENLKKDFLSLEQELSNNVKLLLKYLNIFYVLKYKLSK